MIEAATLRKLAWECGFELAGSSPAGPLAEAAFYQDWARRGMAAGMTYLTDHRADMRSDPRSLLSSARSVISVARLYNGPQPLSTRFGPDDHGWVSRYAWGDDYHGLMRRGLEELARKLAARRGIGFEWKICVDTAPMLERACARRAGLGWIGKNTCLIHQIAGSWFFLGELLVSIEIEPGVPPADRCGSCTRCIDACPTRAIVPSGTLDGPAWMLDSRLCVSYLTIELRGATPEDLRAPTGNHVFGCDICQDVCPWNRRAPMTLETGFAPRRFRPALEELAALTADEFLNLFGGTPVVRAKYAGFLRNVAVAMGNSGQARFRAPLERMAQSADPVVAEHARWALGRIA